MSLNETLVLVALWCGGHVNAPSEDKNSCKARLMECLKLEDIGISRANVIGCFKNTRMV